MISKASRCIIFLLLSFASFGLSHNHFSNSSVLELSKQQSERLIKGFNLFPGGDINIIEKDPLVNAAKLVEQSFRFPELSGYQTDAANGTTSIQDFGHHAGYFSLPHTKSARMFYFFFESRSNRKDAPVVVWLTGGPGCSGSLALFYENGPFHLTNDLSLTWNDFGWDKESNIIYLDQPIGTGFSYSTSEDDIRSTSEEAAVDFSDFLQAFFKKHPEYAKNDFFITGESYAGHYIPAFATEIQGRNKNKQGIPINLKGIAIGNGLTNPEIQYKADLDYALNAKIIDKSQFSELDSLASECGEEAQACGKNNSSACSKAYSTCNSLFSRILNDRNINYYDIRKECIGSLCYDFSNVGKFLNKKSVKDALGVGDDIQFVSCSSLVSMAMAGEEMKNFAVYIPPLLQGGVKVLIYAGEYDLICNWLGNSRWVDDLKWPSYSSAPTTDFTVENKKYGLVKVQGPLTFLKVFDAGHLVPMDQPKASLEMLRRWTQGKPL